MVEVLLSAILLTQKPVPYPEPNSPETYRCLKWTWRGDVYERKVYCLEWVKKDCSKRLYKEICSKE